MATYASGRHSQLDDITGAGVTAPGGSAWSRACAALRGELGDDTFGSWIAPANLRQDHGGRLVVVTPTGIARDWIRRNAWRRLNELFAQNDPDQRHLELKSRSEFEHELQIVGEGQVAEPPPPVVSLPNMAPAPMAQASAGRTSALQERFNFDSFVAGPGNEFALSAARRVAAWGEGYFNPVLIHGPYGFGKTHLLNAIAWEAQRQRPDAKVVFLTAERFLANFVKAVMDRSGAAFKEDLRGADLLLIDDVHFIGGKKSSQEELFHTLAALMGEGRRVVFTADRPPSAIAEIDARLRSYLGAGLVCGIETADRAMRLGILERKLPQLAQAMGVSGEARPEVLQFLADRFPDSIRELEGGLNTLVARAGDRLARLTVEEVQGLLRPHLRAGGERRLTVDDIQKAVAEHYGLKKEDLLSERRNRSVARPRQAAMYLAKQLTTRSYPDIGRRFGGRDHTTVLHAVRKIEELKASDAGIAADLETLVRKLRD